ncbi:triose-phosphate isomerase [Swaminathania salitolerans]|uniref:Triosephosphate isomerase n=1 Tax=Swaminathania salitolerans TaxID=182838 RepID=A0A511BNY3_9PROT|nr:triose-phosphate isomerase [Swaminathania salitolerans]GBQ15269.1 triosephosphate isomerase [Swaminathania salitolerans LMG 21291]GEL02047.1 triosephosphate isomerase [Swaminathania salitolerans]
MRQMIMGNWKMHGLRGSGERLAREIAKGADPACVSRDLVIAPPFTLLSSLAPLLSPHGIGLAAQDCHEDPDGAHTGDIAAPMLADLGVSHVILGHSERRQNHHESSALICRKVEAAQKSGLIPVLCVGETEADKAADRVEDVLGRQIEESLPRGFSGIVAYEPVWAIGTGQAATEQDISDRMAFLHAAIARHLETDDKATRILYGGSVKPEDAASILAVPGVGGVLVGGASLTAESFLGIARAGLKPAY